MKYLNIQTSVLTSPEYVGAEPCERATWLNLSLWCALQENDGIIRDCRHWKDRRWQQTCGVTLAEILGETETHGETQEKPTIALWTWHGDDIHVFAYPLTHQTATQTKTQAGENGGSRSTPEKQAAARENGKKGGRKPKQKPKRETQITQAETQAGNPNNPSRNPTKDNIKEGNVTEDNIKEEEESAAAAAETHGVKISLLDPLLAAYPRRTHYAETLQAARNAILRLSASDDCTHAEAAVAILAGIQRIAEAIDTWTEGEKLKFIKRPPEFFDGDHWRDDPIFWRSRHGHTTTASPATNAAVSHGRRPAQEINC